MKKVLHTYGVTDIFLLGAKNRLSITAKTAEIIEPPFSFILKKKLPKVLNSKNS